MKHGPNERTEQNSRKGTKENGDVQPTRCRIQNIGYNDAQGLIEDLNSIKNPVRNEGYTNGNKE